jgi:hypothetical protein
MRHSDVLRRCARCTVCGHKGATLKHPSRKNGEIEWEPFPVEEDTEQGCGDASSRLSRRSRATT